MHLNKGKTIQQCLADRTDYALNPDKTDNMTYVSSYACNPKTVDAEFALSKRQYFQNTGRIIENDIIAYQLRQSFKPGEITPEEANKISYELASRLLKGQHAFFVATHVDKHHIHSHIIFNSTSLDCTYKFRNVFNSYNVVRKLADEICNEHKLSVIENPGHASPSYNRWEGCKEKISHRDILISVIDEIIKNEKPKTFDEFIHKLESKGYKIKYGKNISVKSPMQKRFIRLNSLSDGYNEQSIIKIIAGTKSIKSYNKDKPSMLIDIEKAIADGKGIGYQNWAKAFNLKQMAKTFSYLQENNLLSYTSLSQTINDEKIELSELETVINNSQKRMDEIKELKTHIINYAKNSSVYADYKKCNRDPKFQKEHEPELKQYMDAKHYFDSINVDKKLPKTKELDEEFRKCLSEKREAINLMRPLKSEHRKHLIYQENVRLILDIDKSEKRVHREH